MRNATEWKKRIENDLEVLLVAPEVKQFLTGYCLGLIHTSQTPTPARHCEASSADLDMRDRFGRRE